MAFEIKGGMTRAPSQGCFIEQAGTLHEKRLTTLFVSESCVELGNRFCEA